MFDFLPAQYYSIVYFVIVTILTISVRKQHSPQHIKSTQSSTEMGNVLWVIFFTLFIGLRPISGRYFVDMANYDDYYRALYDGVPFHFQWNADNFIFDNLFAWWGAVRLGSRSLFIFMSAIYFGASYLGIRRIFPNHKLMAYTVFLGAFSTFSYATNGIKSGVATSLFIWALGYRDNLKKCLPLLLLSFGFHHSMQMPICAFIVTLIFKKPKFYFSLWVMCLMCALLHITIFQTLFGSMSDEQGASYLMVTEDDWGGRTGFRFDFVLYSAMPVLIGYYTIFKKRIKVSVAYTQLLNLYLCTNAVWMLCMYANFTNRIAYLSWFLYPIVLIYPLLNPLWGSGRDKALSKTIIYHIAFTLFMTFIY